MYIVQLLFIVSIEAAFTLTASYAVKIKCSNVDGVFYTVPGSHCKSFYKCILKGHREVNECGVGLIFDFNAQRCVASSDSCSEPTCFDKANEVFQDTTHGCTRFYTCFAGRLTSIDNCPKKQRHNGKTCLNHDSISCGQSHSSRDHICHERLDGSYAVDTNWQEYITCAEGKITDVKKCRKGFHFHSGKQQCLSDILSDFISSDERESRSYMGNLVRKQKFDGILFNPLNLSIEEKIIGVKECPLGQYFDPESRNCVIEDFADRRRYIGRGLSLECDGKANGFYVDENCETYYYCRGGHKTEYMCSAGKLFNGDSCVSKLQYKCPSNERDALCQSHPDGYYKDFNDGCRAYHYCLNGHRITYLCEMGYVFDGKVKKCVREKPNDRLICQSDLLCYGKSDGYHADLTSNCINYTYCKNYEKITQLTCRNNNVFNGQKCVSPSEYACPSLFNYKQINCMPRHCSHNCEADGFYPDLNTDCRGYFFCIAGKTSKLSCPMGKRFNGEICVAEDKFICPVFCDSKHDVYGSCPLGGYIEIVTEEPLVKCARICVEDIILV